MLVDVNTKPKERYLAVCNDVLVVLREKKITMSKKNLSLILAIPLADAELSELSIAGHRHTFIVHSPARVAIFSAHSKYDKMEWMKLIRECIGKTTCIVNKVVE